MTSVKTMFRHSTVNDKLGVIYYRIIHNRVVRQMATEYHVYPNEWDGKSLVPAGDTLRRDF